MIRRVLWWRSLQRVAFGGGLAVLVLAWLVALLATAKGGDDLTAVLVIWGVYGGSLLTGAVAILWPVVFARRRRQRHPIYTQLSDYGEPREVLRAIDAELRRGATWLQGRPRSVRVWLFPTGVVLTESWLIWFAGVQTALVHLSDLTWAFKRAVAIPGGWGFERTVYDARLHRRALPARTVAPPGGEDAVDLLLQILVEVRPEVLSGYRPEWYELRSDGRTALAEEVDRRRAEFERLSEDDREAWIDRALDDLDVPMRVDASSK